MTLMGGPIDTRRSPTEVNKVAETRGVDWFKRHCIVTVPFGHPGAFRQVYPGFLQLSGFMAMNLDRHMIAHRDMFQHLVRGDGDRAEKHREFYDEYMAVMDLTAEFYLQTVETVFVNHDLPRGEMTHRGEPVDLLAIRRCAIMAVEGEKDDISGVGQTLAALELTPNLSSDKKLYYLQAEVGHYGVFNGRRFRSEIAPRIVEFTRTHGRDGASAARSTPRADVLAPSQPNEEALDVSVPALAPSGPVPALAHAVAEMAETSASPIALAAALEQPAAPAPRGRGPRRGRR
jgi:poly(3-hydroxybutyrate) depolymerase